MKKVIRTALDKKDAHIKKWTWKMDWCRKNGLSPVNYEVWEKAEKAYQDEQNRIS